jgi:hypothetical protein
MKECLVVVQLEATGQVAAVPAGARSMDSVLAIEQKRNRDEQPAWIRA